MHEQGSLPQFFLTSSGVADAARRIFLILCIGFAVGCEPAVPDGRIRIRNDFQDREYNILEVSGGGARFSLSPGEFHLLPGGTRRITFSRRYRDHTKRYEVTCPPVKGAGITIKLIDVHLNRIAGGCVTTNATQE